MADRAKFFTPAHGIQITIMVFVMSVAVLIDIISYVLLTNGVPRERLNGTLEWIFGDCVQIAIMMAIVNITRTELVFLGKLYNNNKVKCVRNSNVNSA